MKRGWILALLLPFLLAPVTGCRVEAEDDDDDVELKIDNDGRSRGVSIDAD